MSRSCLYPVVAKANKALEELPHDPDILGITLKELGFTGERHNPQGCPLSRYFRNKTGINLRVYSTYIIVDINDQSSIFIINNMPIWIKRFVDLFDSGYFPELVRRS